MEGNKQARLTGRFSSRSKNKTRFRLRVGSSPLRLGSSSLRLASSLEWGRKLADRARETGGETERETGRFSSWAKKQTIFRLRVGPSPLASSPRLLASSPRLLASLSGAYSFRLSEVARTAVEAEGEAEVEAEAEAASLAFPQPAGFLLGPRRKIYSAFASAPCLFAPALRLFSSAPRFFSRILQLQAPQSHKNRHNLRGSYGFWHSKF